MSSVGVKPSIGCELSGSVTTTAGLTLSAAAADLSVVIATRSGVITCSSVSPDLRASVDVVDSCSDITLHRPRPNSSPAKCAEYLNVTGRDQTSRMRNGLPVPSVSETFGINSSLTLRDIELCSVLSHDENVEEARASDDGGNIDDIASIRGDIGSTGAVTGVDACSPGSAADEELGDKSFSARSELDPSVTAVAVVGDRAGIESDEDSGEISKDSTRFSSSGFSSCVVDSDDDLGSDGSKSLTVAVTGEATAVEAITADKQCSSCSELDTQDEDAEEAPDDDLTDGIDASDKIPDVTVDDSSCASSSRDEVASSADLLPLDPGQNNSDKDLDFELLESG